MRQTLIVAAFLLLVSSAYSQITETTLHDFTEYYPETSNTGELSQAADGNFYGVTTGTGLFFKITPGGVFTQLSYSPPNFITSALIQGPDGNFYGSYYYGPDGDQSSGSNCAPDSCGAIFKMTPSGKLSIVYQFTGKADGALLQGNLMLGSDGNFYGTAEHGGDLSQCVTDSLPPGCGTVFKLTPAGELTVLYTFSGKDDGGVPSTGVIEASDGNFYGITAAGGDISGCNPLDAFSGCGTVFRLNPSGALSTQYMFENPYSGGTFGATSQGLVEGSDGALYGASGELLFRLSLAGAESTLKFLSNQTSARLTGGLYAGSNGLLYGTEEDGLFLLSDSGQYGLYSNSAVSFTAGTMQGSDGNFYGTGTDTVYKITVSPALPAPVQLTLSPANLTLGNSTNVRWVVTNAFSLTMQQCYAFVNQGGALTPLGRVVGTYSESSHLWTGGLKLTPPVSGGYNLTLTCGGTESGFATLTVH